MTQTKKQKKKWTILGVNPDVLIAMWANILSWIVSLLGSKYTSLLLPTHPAEQQQQQEQQQEKEKGKNNNNIIINKKNNTRCISIGRPGGLEQLRIITLKDDICTIGYNMREYSLPPFTPPVAIASSNSNSNKNENSTHAALPHDAILLENDYFSINYADCCIRWGLYESANKFVGYPIVPGFDVAGRVGAVGESVTDLKPGDEVYGCTLFGAYSSRIVVPRVQLRRIPESRNDDGSSSLSLKQAAALPAVSLTALYALQLAGFWPTRRPFRNKAILIHSAAGGVGSMLVQMSRLLGLSPIVGVVGSAAKVDAAKDLGCDVVIDRSGCDLWEEVERASPQTSGLYAAIMDANGVSTLEESYNHLAATGRLIVYGFHSNLPLGRGMLSPWEWLKMARNMFRMPKIDPMDLTASNKAIIGFNLSFFADEKEIVTQLFDQVNQWVMEKKLKCPKVEEMSMDDIGKAHAFIQSGKSIGKIVISTRQCA